MKLSVTPPTTEKVFGIFALFFLGTVSFFSFILIPIPDVSFKEGLRLGMLLFGAFSYELVAIAILGYYISKATKTAVDLFNQHPKAFYVGGVLLLCATYLVLSMISGKPASAIGSDAVMVVLILIAMPFVHEYITKKQNSLPPPPKEEGK